MVAIPGPCVALPSCLTDSLVAGRPPQRLQSGREVCAPTAQWLGVRCATMGLSIPMGLDGGSSRGCRVDVHAVVHAFIGECASSAINA